MSQSDSKKIFLQYKQKKIDKEALITFLTLVIEQSDYENLRAEAIHLLERLKLKEQIKIFDLFENVLISDESVLVKIAAFRALLKIFPHLSKKPIKWVIKSIDHFYMLKLLNDFLDRNGDEQLDNLRLELKKCLVSIFKTTLDEAKVLLDLNTIHVSFGERSLINYSKDDNNVFLLNLDRLGLNHLPKCIRRLQSLTELSLKDNKFMTFPKEILSFKKLRDIDLSRNKLNALPNEIEILKDLYIIDLSYNKFEKIPQQLNTLPNLLHLNLANNPIEGININLPLLQQLESLRVNDKIFVAPNIEKQIKYMIDDRGLFEDGKNSYWLRGMGL